MADNKISISELGDRIAYYRKRKLLTQKELGEKITFYARIGIHLGI